jgi:hypothetical protein
MIHEFAVLINTVQIPKPAVRRANLTDQVGTISGWGITFAGKMILCIQNET